MVFLHGYHLAFDDTTGFPFGTVFKPEFQKPKQYWKTVENEAKSTGRKLPKTWNLRKNTPAFPMLSKEEKYPPQRMP